MAAPRFQFLILACTRETACPFLLSPEVKKCLFFFILFIFSILYSRQKETWNIHRDSSYSCKKGNRETKQTERRKSFQGGCYVLLTVCSFVFCFFSAYIFIFLFFGREWQWHMTGRPCNLNYRTFFSHTEYWSITRRLSRLRFTLVDSRGPSHALMQYLCTQNIILQHE